MFVFEFGRVVVEMWVCGFGIYGEFGIGKWFYVFVVFFKVKVFFDFYEYDEVINIVYFICFNKIVVGSIYVCVVMDNVYDFKGNFKGGLQFGNDVLFWGGNESYQLGMGKRNNMNVLIYIGVLDGDSVGVGKMDGELGRNRF